MPKNRFASVFRMTLLCLAALFAGNAARAQVAVYGTFQGTRLDQGSTWLKGGTLGIYDDFYHFGPIHLGGDVRGTRVNGDDGVALTQVMTGFRVAVKPPVLPIRPYAELLGGGAKLSGSTDSNSFEGAAEINGGVDFTFFPHLDWRVAEIGRQIAGTSAQQNFHVSTGLVVRFF